MNRVRILAGKLPAGSSTKIPGRKPSNRHYDIMKTNLDIMRFGYSQNVSFTTFQVNQVECVRSNVCIKDFKAG